MRIRKGTGADIAALQQLFAATISTVCREDYSDEQLQVWIHAGLNNEQKWKFLAEDQYLLVAEDDEEITGFCSLAENGYLDLLYVHKDQQGKGIAAALYSAAEEEALLHGKAYITADVSITARYFFEKMGFDMLAEQTLIRDGVELNNYKMRKQLCGTAMHNATCYNSNGIRA